VALGAATSISTTTEFEVGLFIVSVVPAVFIAIEPVAVTEQLPETAEEAFVPAGVYLFAAVPVELGFISIVSLVELTLWLSVVATVVVVE
jgi:hypothetical protein